MTYYTHVAGGILAGTALTGTAFDVNTGIVIGGAIIGSLLPDIDHTKSKISRTTVATSFVSHIIHMITKHRGVFHTPIFVLIIWILMNLVNIFVQFPMQEFMKLFTMGFIPGMLSHLVLDSLNPGGIMWLYPIKSKYYHILNIKTGSILEAILAVILIIILIIIYRM